MAKKLLTNQRSKFILTQKEEMVSQISHLIGLSAFLILGFMAVLIIVNELALSLPEEFWLLSFALIIWAIIFWLFSLVATRYVSRAFYFHLLISISTFFFICAPLFFLIWIVPNLVGKYGWIINFVIVTSLVVGYTDEFKQNLNRLKDIEKFLVKSGRFDKEQGTWNIKVPIELHPSNDKSKSNTFIGIMLIQLITFGVSVFISPPVKSVYIVGYLWAIVFLFPFRKIGEPVATFVQLLFWEMDLGIPIIIAPDEKD